MSLDHAAEAPKGTGGLEPVHWLLVTAVLAGCAAAAEALGTHTIRVGALQIVILPLLIAFIATATINVVTQRIWPLFVKSCQHVAGAVLSWLALIFVLRAGVVFGENLPLILDNGTVLVIQSIGKIGTILAFPLALVLGMQKSAVGATFSIGREPSLSVIQQRYGLGSPEMIGVLATYITGTIFGTLFFSIVAALGSALGFSTQALALACGTGSGGMTFSCSGSLTQLRDDIDSSTILALATASDVLSYLVTIILGTFITMPLLERLSRTLLPKEREKRNGGKDSRREEFSSASENTMENRGQITSLSALVSFIIIFLITTLVKGVSGAGMVFVSATALVATTLFIRWIPVKFQKIFPLPIFAAIVGVSFSAPEFPWAETASSALADVDLLTLASGVLACAGLAINQQQLKIIGKFGWRAVVVAFFVFGGSYFVSASLAQLAI